MALNLPNPAQILGVMSGTSLDGLDLALCEFNAEGNNFSYKITKAKTIDYPEEWREKLSSIQEASAASYFLLNAQYGEFISGQINAFLIDVSLKPAAIASHGHTVFHQPQSGFSAQIGCGATIAANTGITTVCDFRSMDVALHGQGAPLVPVGDRLLFAEYDGCLNIGGIANISCEKRNERIAYDICVANMLLNFLAEKTGARYDSGGELARSGNVQADLLARLNGLEFYQQKGAKSLGREWFEKFILPLMQHPMSIPDLLATCTEHIAVQIATGLTHQQLANVLVTGGGAFNTFLMERIRSLTSCQVIIPNPEVVNFKEALIFAFLGYLRLNNKANALGSVTGAGRDSVGGAVYAGMK